MGDVHAVPSKPTWSLCVVPGHAYLDVDAPCERVEHGRYILRVAATPFDTV